MSGPPTGVAEGSWVDLASERLGGQALLANDEFFAPKENLIRATAPIFDEGRYTDRGKWMDGWETRRRRKPGHDWCIVRLGLPGVIHSVTVDTAHFHGNYPEACSLDACEAAKDASPEELVRRDGWSQIVPRSPLRGDSANRFAVDDRAHHTHVRLNIEPDGGVARLRVYGKAVPDWTELGKASRPLDLAAIQNGGLVLECSDKFFSEPVNLILPGRGADMRDGWETRRRRGPGHDWVILELGHRCVVDRIDVDTRHFKGNFPESCSLEACDAPEGASAALVEGAVDWTELLPRTKLEGHNEHAFEKIERAEPVTHVRFNIYPDGGVSRLRVYGRLAE